MEKEYINASLVKRGVAYIIDIIVAFAPALVVYIIFTGTYSGLTPLYYPAPVVGAVSMADLPVAVDERVSTVTTDDGGIVTTHNYSTSATAARMLSVAVIIMYVGYSAFCTVMYDGKTVGKKFMHIKTVSTGDYGFTKAMLFREIIGKIIINSTVIVPVLSIFTILFTKERKAIHDFIGKTRVVED